MLKLFFLFNIVFLSSCLFSQNGSTRTLYSTWSETFNFETQIRTSNKYLYSDNLELIELYPNPGYSEVFLKVIATTNPDATIRLYDINTNLIEILFSSRLNDGENLISFNVDDLQVGSYVIRIQSNGEIIGSIKFIKL